MEAKVQNEPRYVLVLSKEEARYLKALMNCAPYDLANGVLEGKYTTDEISKITGHASENSMWDTINKVV